MNEYLTFEDLEIEVRRSARRKHVDLVVDRDGQIVVSVPQALSNADICQICKDKKVWIYRTLDHKGQSLYESYPKKYVTGEGFYYLGRKYRLKVLYQFGNDSAPLHFLNGRFLLRSDNVEKGNELFIEWYTQYAQIWLEKKIGQLDVRVAVKPQSVQVRDLGYRWASCTKSNKLHFHWRIILLPPEQIEYLILHELVHLIEHSHSKEFYKRLSWACPSYREHENWLRLNGDQYRL